MYHAPTGHVAFQLGCFYFQFLVLMDALSQHQTSCDKSGAELKELTLNTNVIHQCKPAFSHTNNCACHVFQDNIANSSLTLSSHSTVLIKTLHRIFTLTPSSLVAIHPSTLPTPIAWWLPHSSSASMLPIYMFSSTYSALPCPALPTSTVSGPHPQPYKDPV